MTDEVASSEPRDTSAMKSHKSLRKDGKQVSETKKEFQAMLIEDG